MTKLRYYTIKNKIPAGIFEGVESFLFDNEKWLIHNGQAQRFEDATLKVKCIITDAFLKDETSKSYLKKIGITAFSEGFEMWYRCVVGALDETPDFKDGNLAADAYNHACKDYDCPHRGRLCSLTAGLKNFEVKTLAALKKGETIEHTAESLFMSVPGLKSRIEVIKEKMGATNMASLIAKAVEFGI